MKLPGVIEIKGHRFYFGKGQRNNEGWVISTQDNTNAGMSRSMIANPSLSLINAIDMFLQWEGIRPPSYFPFVRMTDIPKCGEPGHNCSCKKSLILNLPVDEVFGNTK